MVTMKTWRHVPMVPRSLAPVEFQRVQRRPNFTVAKRCHKDSTTRSGSPDIRRREWIRCIGRRMPNTAQEHLPFTPCRLHTTPCLKNSPLTLASAECTGTTRSTAARTSPGFQTTSEVAMWTRDWNYFQMNEPCFVSAARHTASHCAVIQIWDSLRISCTTLFQRYI